MQRDLTKGKILSTLLFFSIPMILGDLLQQCYNIADTIIVGRFLGEQALAAVGSAFSLMTLLTSILLGFAMGSGTIFSICVGQKNHLRLKQTILSSFLLLLFITLLLNLLIYIGMNEILSFLNIPLELYSMMQAYLQYVFAGLFAIFLYNFFASLLRSLGNSTVPLIFLALASLLNILLDIWFIAGLQMGVEGAAIATMIAQYVSGFGIAWYSWRHYPALFRYEPGMHVRFSMIQQIFQFSFLTCLQQSIMNLGIVLVQGVVNRFGTTIMAAFAAGVKIDAFAYLPVQDFGNAFSIFVAQNYGAQQEERIKKGIKIAFISSISFAILISFLVYVFAQPLMSLFIDASSFAVIQQGMLYLRIEGAFYCLIALLFLLYGFYRAIQHPGISLILTILSLGTRVLLSYAAAAVPSIGVIGIWWSIVIGWLLADSLGIGLYWKRKAKWFLIDSSTRSIR